MCSSSIIFPTLWQKKKNSSSSSSSNSNQLQIVPCDLNILCYILFLLWWTLLTRHHHHLCHCPDKVPASWFYYHHLETQKHPFQPHTSNLLTTHGLKWMIVLQLFISYKVLNNVVKYFSTIAIIQLCKTHTLNILSFKPFSSKICSFKDTTFTRFASHLYASSFTFGVYTLHRPLLCTLFSYPLHTSWCYQLSTLHCCHSYLDDSHV